MFPREITGHFEGEYFQEFHCTGTGNQTYNNNEKLRNNCYSIITVRSKRVTYVWKYNSTVVLHTKIPSSLGMCGVVGSVMGLR